MTVQQCIANFLLTHRSTTHPTTGRTQASLFLGREVRTWLTLLHSSKEDKVMDSQAKQKVTLDTNAKFGELYPGEQIQVKDLRTHCKWWPGSVAE